MIFAVVDFFPPPVFTLFPSMSSLLSFFSPSNGTVVEIQTYVQSKKRSAFLVLFLSECGWGD